MKKTILGLGLVAILAGVGLAQMNAIDRRVQSRRRDLLVDGAGAVAEFRRADGEVEAAIVAHRDRGFRNVATRRHGVDHRDRHAFADQPIVG